MIRRKILRITILSLGILIILTGVAAVLCVDSIDYQPYFRTSYYRETVSRLEASVATNHAAFDQLHAGFGKALLNPPVNAASGGGTNGAFQNIPLAGYGGRKGRPATGVHDDVFVKAAAFRVGNATGVVASADALIVPREVCEIAFAKLHKSAGLRREQLYLGATHSHSSLGGWGQGLVAEAFAGGFQPGVREWFAERIVLAVKSALADLKPAALGAGSVSVPEFTRNRLVGRLGNVDAEFAFLVVRQEQGISGIIGSYSAHATVLGSDNMQFSGDYPGAWQRAVEQATSGSAIFLAGGLGSHSPSPQKKGLDGVEFMGSSLASRVVAQLPMVQLTNRVAFQTLGVDITLPQLHARLSDGLRLKPWLARKLLPVEGTTFAQVFRFNNSVWLGTPCDFSGELALGVKDYARRLGGHAVVTSFNGDYIGYIVPSRYYHMDGYEPRLMSFFGPHMADYLDEVVRKLTSAALAE